MNIVFKKDYLPFYISIGFLLCALALELTFILHLNNGLLVYTLDDPYIHLSLAQHIRQGHYGINLNEFSSPSSNILWPLIIAPFSNYPSSLFILNCAATVATVFLFVKVLSVSTKTIRKSRPLLISAAVVLLLLATNIIGLPFTGMEHSLQVFLVVLIAYGLITEVEKGKVPIWLLAAIIIAPLIRYECLAISIPALLYLVRYKYYKPSLVACALLVICIGGFSVFLVSLGLDPLPSSILVKTANVQNGGSFQNIVLNLQESIFLQRQGVILLFILTTLVAYRLVSKDKKKKALATVTIFSILVHFIAGKYDWYHRYEIYILSFSLLTSAYLWIPIILSFLEKRPKSYSFAVLGATSLLVFFIGKPYIDALPTIPIASNNIYEQQYQMHRFVVGYYKQPVAVNDLGYVSYKNDNYVLDLWGLGSSEAFKYRSSKTNKNWISELCNKSNVHLIMVYEEWFENIPSDFIKIGSLHLGKRRITPSHDKVSFYATDQNALHEVKVKLQLFVKTLPPNVSFTFQQVSDSPIESP